MKKIKYYKINMSTKVSHHVSREDALKILSEKKQITFVLNENNDFIGVNKSFIVDITPDYEREKLEKDNNLLEKKMQTQIKIQNG